MALPAIITGLVKPVIDGVFRWKEGEDKMELSRQDFELMKIKLESEIQSKMAELESKPTQEFRDFMLKYEGEASEQSKRIRDLRASVRPFITYWSVLIITLIMFGAVDGEKLQKNLAAIPEPLWKIFLAIFAFWFGGRAVMQVAESWQKGNADREREVQRGQVYSSAQQAKAALAQKS